jgi:DNA/RNA-binding domain of Phe-tRNA-synthetase-like protein
MTSIRGAGEPASHHAPTEGWVAEDVRHELPGLRLLSVVAGAGRRRPLTGDSPRDIEARLRSMSSRFRGARAIAVRREPLTAAYRIFFRQIGLDPDVERTPVEAAVLERMLRGGFPTGGLLDDVLTIAMLETGVPVWAFDVARLDGPLGIRTSREAEPLGTGRGAPLIGEGRLVVADAAAALCPIFGSPTSSHAVCASTREVALFALQVPGVPELYVDEALWSARAALEAP